MKTLDESRFRELLERHLEDRLSDGEARELLEALEADAGLRRRAADEAILAAVLAGVLRPQPIDMAPRVLAALRNDSEKTTLLRRVMERLPSRCPVPDGGRACARAVLVRRGLLAAAAALLVAVAGAAAYRALRPATTAPPADGGAPELARRPSEEPVERENRPGTRSQESRRAPVVAPPPGTIRWRSDADPGSVEPEPALEQRTARRTAVIAPPERQPEEPRRTRVTLEPDEPPAVAQAAPAPVRERLVLARLDAASGGVTIESAGARLTPSRGMALRAHDILRTPARGSAVIRYDDGTRIEADGESTVILATTMELSGADAAGTSDGGKRVTLERGMIEADVAAQPPDQPMVFVTPVADVVVMGTRLALWASAESTRVEVRSGRTVMSRRSDGASVEVRSGQVAVAAAGQPLAARSESKPVLACAAYPARGDVDLDREGALDWVAWSWNETVQTVRRRETSPETKVGGLTVFNAAPLGGWASLPVTLSWTDGRPIPRGTSVGGGVKIPGFNNGFQFAVPADRVARTLRLYVGVASGQGRLEAVLRDGSAPPVDDTSVSAAAGEIQATVYSIRYAAASEGQSMTVRWTLVQSTAGAARHEAKGGEGAGRAVERDSTRREEPFAILQAVTISDALVADPDARKGRGD